MYDRAKNDHRICGIFWSDGEGQTGSNHGCHEQHEHAGVVHECHCGAKYNSATDEMWTVTGDKISPSIESVQEGMTQLRASIAEIMLGVETIHERGGVTAVELQELHAALKATTEHAALLAKVRS
jgi:hypothetical protein